MKLEQLILDRCTFTEFLNLLRGWKRKPEYANAHIGLSRRALYRWRTQGVRPDISGQWMIADLLSSLKRRDGKTVQITPQDIFPQ